MSPDQGLALIAVSLLGTLICARRTIRAIRSWRRDDYRTRNDRRNAWLTACDGDRPEPGHPGNDQQALATCNAILRATETREEQP